ncbi:hypothetical protein PENSPDRAFT_690645 [Peniophora sp. CONT]|nr:hypothetical protein PENSPDRAFT_690645 [Peniophora sp. CONT]
MIGKQSDWRQRDEENWEKKRLAFDPLSPLHSWCLIPKRIMSASPAGSPAGSAAGSPPASPPPIKRDGKKGRKAKSGGATAKAPSKKRGGKKVKNEKKVDGRGRPRKVPELQLADIRAFGPQYVDARDSNDAEGVKRVFRDASGMILGKYGWDDPMRAIDEKDGAVNDGGGIEAITEAEIKRATSAADAKTRAKAAAKENGEEYVDDDEDDADAISDATLAMVYKRVKTTLFEEYNKIKGVKASGDKPFDAKAWLQKLSEPPRRYPEYAYFVSYMDEEMDAEVDAEMAKANAESAANGEIPAPKASFQNSVAAKYLKTASEEVKLEVRREREKDYETRMKAWEAQCQLKPESREQAREFAMCINPILSQVAKCVADLVSGMCVWLTVGPDCVLLAEGTLDVEGRTTKNYSQTDDRIIQGLGAHVSNQVHLLNEQKWPADADEIMASGTLEKMEDIEDVELDARWPGQVGKVRIPAAALANGGVSEASSSAGLSTSGASEQTASGASAREGAWQVDSPAASPPSSSAGSHGPLEQEKITRSEGDSGVEREVQTAGGGRKREAPKAKAAPEAEVTSTTGRAATTPSGEQQVVAVKAKPKARPIVKGKHAVPQRQRAGSRRVDSDDDEEEEPSDDEDGEVVLTKAAYKGAKKAETREVGKEVGAAGSGSTASGGSGGEKTALGETDVGGSGPAEVGAVEKPDAKSIFTYPVGRELPGLDSTTYAEQCRDATSVLDGRKKWFAAIRMGPFLAAVPSKLPKRMAALACEVARSYWKFESSNADEGRLVLAKNETDAALVPAYTNDLLRKLAGGNLTRVAWAVRARSGQKRTGALLDEDVGKSLASQWALQQPEARRDEDQQLKCAAVASMSWDGRLCAGILGVRLLVVTLLCWGANVTDEAEMHEWDRLAIDFIDVLQVLGDQAGEYVAEEGPVEQSTLGAEGKKRERVRKPSAKKAAAEKND